MSKRPFWWICCASIMLWVGQTTVASEPESSSDAPTPAAEGSKTDAGPTVDGPVRQTPLPSYGDEVSEKSGAGESRQPAGESSAAERPNDHPPATSESDKPADAKKPAESSTTPNDSAKETAREKETPPVVRELTPALTALRDRVRRCG